MQSDVLRIGSLDDDLAEIAGAVHHSVRHGSRMVWIDDRRRVFIGLRDENPLVPTRWILGTFGPGHTVQLIEDDLRAMWRERSAESAVT